MLSGYRVDLIGLRGSDLIAIHVRRWATPAIWSNSAETSCFYRQAASRYCCGKKRDMDMQQFRSRQTHRLLSIAQIVCAQKRALGFGYIVWAQRRGTQSAAVNAGWVTLYLGIYVCFIMKNRWDTNTATETAFLGSTCTAPTCLNPRAAAEHRFSLSREQLLGNGNNVQIKVDYQCMGRDSPMCVCVQHAFTINAEMRREYYHSVYKCFDLDFSLIKRTFSWSTYTL